MLTRRQCASPPRLLSSSTRSPTSDRAPSPRLRPHPATRACPAPRVLHIHLRLRATRRAAAAAAPAGAERVRADRGADDILPRAPVSARTQQRLTRPAGSAPAQAARGQSTFRSISRCRGSPAAYRASSSSRNRTSGGTWRRRVRSSGTSSGRTVSS